MLTPAAETYPSQALKESDVRTPCASLPPAWRTLLEPMFAGDGTLHVQHIATGGSDRSFYRVSDAARSAIMCVTPNCLEFRNYVAIGEFLRGWGLPLPAIYAHSDLTGLAVLQDAGRTALQDIVLQQGAQSPQTAAAYQSVLRVLGKMQTVPASRCENMSERPFSYTDLRWETEYFRENLLKRHLGWDMSGDEALTVDFEALAERVLAEPLFPMHRDFQSQNVFVDQESVWILDFQGARIGPLHYDLASLLRDPYVSLPADVEEALLGFYFAHAMPANAPYLSWQVFRDTYALVSLQRLMQALGAYGFLGLVKGKPWFLRWIGPALTLLKRAVREVGGLPRLQAVVEEADDRHQRRAGDLAC